MVTGVPVKWTEDRSENLMATAFARDYHMSGEIASTSDGRILALRVRVLADHGAFNCTAQPSKYPAGFFHVVTGSYDLEAAHCAVTGVYTNKAPGGVAYACSFRIAEASYLVERLVDLLALELSVDPADLRMRNLLRPEQFPYVCATGWEYDSGDYPKALRLALDTVGYEKLRATQERRRALGEYMGIGISFFTEAVGAGPRKHMDIVGFGMADGADLRVHPTGKAVLRDLRADTGSGPRDDVRADRRARAGHRHRRRRGRARRHGRTPFGLGTYGSRSIPVSGAAAVRCRATGPGQGAAHRLGAAGGRRRGPRVDAGTVGGARRPRVGCVAAGDRVGGTRFRGPAGRA